MAVLNLREFPDDLKRELKAECGMSGESLQEYCVRVFRQRDSSGVAHGAVAAPAVKSARVPKVDVPAVVAEKTAVSEVVPKLDAVRDILLKVPQVAPASDPRYIRPAHDPKECRNKFCGLCAAAKGEK
jgi:hypothetical protein